MRSLQISPNRTLVLLLLSVIPLCGCGGDKQAAPGGETKPPTVSKASSHPKTSELPDFAPLEELPQESDTKPPVLVGGFGPDDSSPTPPVAAKAKIYRPSDTRPKHNAAALAELGILRYASKHLVLYTDIKPARAKPLPGLADQLYKALEDYFGPLPPDREGRVFQMTGYIMADRRVFRETGLLPEDLPGFYHGRHRGAEFWMNDQEWDYYLRHLMLHEATHCFMTINRQNPLLPPVWYMEGMAELFGTHRIAKDGTAAFRVMPRDKEAFLGWGRIELIQAAAKEGRFRTLDQVFAFTGDDYSDNGAYAWSWAVCKFLEAHPRYQKPFRELGAAPTYQTFLRQFQEDFKAEADDMRTEWALFAHDLDFGYQIAQAAMTFRPGQPLGPASTFAEVKLQADRGWQSSGVLVEQGKKYTLTTIGQFTLAQKPKPWISEADGISFRYFGGRPLGELLGSIRSTSKTSIPTAQVMRQVFPCGANHTFVATQTGTLYLRLNDAWNQLSDNTGTVNVQVRLAPAK